MVKEKTEVGNSMHFRGFMYEPINEQGVVYLFGLVAEDLNIRVESIQQGYPDCTGLRYKGKGRWERVRIEFEHRSSNFDHNPEGCDIIVCWEDDLDDDTKREYIKKGIEIIELKSRINTTEIPDRELKNPEEESKTEFNLEYHYQRSNVSDKTKDLFNRLDKEIKNIDKEIWDKYSKTAITYYCDEKMFVYTHFRKNLLVFNIYTNQKDIDGVKNIKYHENWGELKVKSEEDINKAIQAINKSHAIMKEAIKNNINTGWYAITPKEKMTWSHDDSDEEFEENLEK